MAIARTRSCQSATRTAGLGSCPVRRGHRIAYGLDERLAGRDRDARIVGIPEPGHGGRDDGPPDRLILVQLDRVEAVGERRDDVRHDQHVGMLQVADHLVAGTRAEKDHPRASQSLRRFGSERVRPDQDERSLCTERPGGLLAECDVDPVFVKGPDVDGDRPAGQIRGTRQSGDGRRRCPPRSG